MENNNLSSGAVDNTVTISVEEYARLTKRSFAVDIIIANIRDESSFRITDTVKYLIAALGEADEK